MTTVQVTIPDALAKEAAAEGLLEPGSIEAILRERLAAARVANMQATRQKLSATATPPVSAEEIARSRRIVQSGSVRLVLDAQAEKTQACHSGSADGSARAAPLHANQKIGNGRLADRFDDGL